jgi:primosomal protein N' (replication factor Y)
MERKTLFVDVLLPVAVPNLYTYRVPIELNNNLKIGARVVVQFGKSKLYTALVYSIHELAPKEYVAKYIESIVDEFPIVNEIQFKFWEWIAYYYLCTRGEVMQAALPAGLKLSSESKITLNTEYDFANLDLNTLTEKEYLIIEILQNKNVVSIDEISELIKIKNVQPHIRTLSEKKIILYLATN